MPNKTAQELAGILDDKLTPGIRDPVFGHYTEIAGKDEAIEAISSYCDAFAIEFAEWLGENCSKISVTKYMLYNDPVPDYTIQQLLTIFKNK